MDNPHNVKFAGQLSELARHLLLAQEELLKTPDKQGLSEERANDLVSTIGNIARVGFETLSEQGDQTRIQKLAENLTVHAEFWGR